MLMNDYACVPACKKCRVAEVCMKALQVRADEDIRIRAHRQSYQQSIKLPCGCYALPAEIVVVFGENVERVQCAEHGWQKLSKTRKKAAVKEAAQVIEKTVKERILGTPSLSGHDEELPF